MVDVILMAIVPIIFASMWLVQHARVRKLQQSLSVQGKPPLKLQEAKKWEMMNFVAFVAFTVFFLITLLLS